METDFRWFSQLDTPFGRIGEQFYYPSEASPRRYGEGSTRLTARNTSMLAPPSDPIPTTEEPSYEEWKWETEWKAEYPEETLLKLKTNNPMWTISGDKELIDVVVGENAAPWSIHKKLLCTHSSFFEVAINSLFREGREKKVVLKDEANEVFSLFVQWIYSGSFTTTSLPLLLRAYVLGDKLGSHRFQVFAFDKIYAMNASRCYFTPEQAVWVAENTLPDSMLRNFTMDAIAIGLVNNTLIPSKEDWQLMAPIYLQILFSVQSLAKFQEKTWRQKSRLHYISEN
ncbi:hypothetical protein VTN77DRAFT_1056 [Rasamsonia byssochlamydoides]|uniref:uncharacterized protein n=1 Tax=Rasamsonia byssochlamydoides TaxID=89139 RepID=UPI00374333B2